MRPAKFTGIGGCIGIFASREIVFLIVLLRSRLVEHRSVDFSFIVLLKFKFKSIK